MHEGPAYTAETNGILIRVRPSYLAGQSDPDEGRWVWAYQIEIVNLTGSTVQLMARRWTITDGHGHVEEVRGPGVVGEQPVLAPGERFEYTSGVPLPTASGFMAGSYQMVTEAGERFEIDVPTFSLDSPSPDGKRVLN